jgi:Family of unknown function (DUF5947)
MTERGRLSVLRKIANRPPAPASGERCDMCAEPIADDHPHVVDLTSRSLMCTCRGCYLLFTARDADLRYRAVPDRYLSFDDFAMGPAQWEALEIPVGLAFFFRNSVLGKTIAFYPGPAGVTESELSLESWDTVLEANPRLRALEPDVEALLIRSPERGRTGFDCHLVPIDACYELAGRLRLVWRGFDGGQDAHAQLDDFFDAVARRSKPAPDGTAPDAAVGTRGAPAAARWDGSAGGESA